MSILNQLIVTLIICSQYVNCSAIECGISKSMPYSISQCNTKNNNRMARVVGGSPSSIEQMPWMAFLISVYGYCGSVIIAERWILTAAHCLGKG